MAGAVPVQWRLNCLVSRRDRSMCHAVVTVVGDSLFCGPIKKLGQYAVSTCHGRETFVPNIELL
jgi:hypothetical protein